MPLYTVAHLQQSLYLHLHLNHQFAPRILLDQGNTSMPLIETHQETQISRPHLARTWDVPYGPLKRLILDRFMNALNPLRLQSVYIPPRKQETYQDVTVSSPECPQHYFGTFLTRKPPLRSFCDPTLVQPSHHEHIDSTYTLPLPLATYIVGICLQRIFSFRQGKFRDLSL